MAPEVSEETTLGSQVFGFVFFVYLVCLTATCTASTEKTLDQIRLEENANQSTQAWEKGGKKLLKQLLDEESGDEATNIASAGCFGVGRRNEVTMTTETTVMAATQGTQAVFGVVLVR